MLWTTLAEVVACEQVVAEAAMMTMLRDPLGQTLPSVEVGSKVEESEYAIWSVMSALLAM